jgi:hypothetical protein
MRSHRGCGPDQRWVGVTARLLLSLTAAGCAGGARREPSVEAGKRCAQPVVDALSKHLLEHNTYPGALGNLVPGYLPATALETCEGEAGAYRLYYERIGDRDYLLHFVLGRYDGQTECAYRPRDGRWTCVDLV